jgi:hypothetical protein
MTIKNPISQENVEMSTDLNKKDKMMVELSHPCDPNCKSDTVVKTVSGEYVCLSCHPDGANAGQPAEWPKTGKFDRVKGNEDKVDPSMFETPKD